MISPDRDQMCQEELCWGRRLHNNKRSFVTGPLWVLKATPCLPLPPSFLPHPFRHTLLTPPNPILGHLMNPRCLGEATEVAVHSRRCFTPLPWQCPQAFTSQGSGGRKGGEDNEVVHKAGPQYCDYLWSGEWGRGSHPVLEGGSDGWEKGWDGMGSRVLGWCVGRGLQQPGRGEEAVCLEPGMVGDSPGSCLPPPEHPSPVRAKGRQGERALLERGSWVKGSSKC